MNYLSKQFVGGLAALMLGTNLSAQTPDWENPSVFAVIKKLRVLRRCHTTTSSWL
jgi:beta-galactosidase